MTRDELLLTVAKGDHGAADFLATVHDIAHVWDDLIDRDVDVSPECIHQAFFSALVRLPRNAFYMRNFEALNAILVSAINNWQVANELERGGSTDDLHISYITRSAYTDLILMVAHLVGGQGWVREIGPTVRRFVHGEGWEGYLSNLQHERAAREQRQGV